MDAEQPVAYARLGEGEALADSREKKFRVICIVFFICNCISALGYLSWMVESYVKDFKQVESTFGFFLSLFACFLLGNSLWGRHNRKYALTAYLGLFEVIPILFYSGMILVFAFGFLYFREIIEDELKKQGATYSATAAMLVIMMGCILADAYHCAAAWVINKYRVIRSERDPSF